MRKLILKMQMSLDGFVGGPNGEVDWAFKTIDADAQAWIVKTISDVGAHLMGSRTFHDMAAWWPTSTEPYAKAMNEIPKVVFSKDPNVAASNEKLTTQALEDKVRVRGPVAASGNAQSWTNARVATGELREEIAKLKAEPGNDILAHGGARFAQSLVREGLIDEYQLMVHPVALGRGLALFWGLHQPLDLQLASATTFPSGAVAHVYRPAPAS
jgi:dihydrofolate reductase